MRIVVRDALGDAIDAMTVRLARDIALESRTQVRILEGVTGADDETRTRDIDLGKVALYQLSYIRRAATAGRRGRCYPSVGRVGYDPC